jgi:hypothetical protein
MEFLLNSLKKQNGQYSMTTDTDRFNQCYSAVMAWADELQQTGWLSSDSTDELRHMDTAQAEALFDEQTQRPLLVAFFGGTGVGKSSLLNRLAGKSIAEVGVVRPTSHHVTLYLHESYRNSLHEQSLPTEETRIAYHSDESKKYFAWLDMPDIDSTEQSNRAVVERWLPMIDWLIYVVTPDRYHDDLGWQFVQARGHDHAWLFVMNHWDEGVPEQWDDFRSKLIDQGFTDPLVLRTSCAQEMPEDDFKALENHLQQALQDHGIETLRHVAHARRWQTLHNKLDSLTQQLSQEKAWKSLQPEWQTLSHEGIDHLHSMLLENADMAYQQWRLSEDSGAKNIPQLQQLTQPGKESSTPSSALNQVYNQRCNNHLVTLGLAIENAVSANNLPVKPMQLRLHKLVTAGQENYLQAIEVGLAISLKKPGNVFTRLSRRLLKLLQWLLPLTAALWAGYHIVSRFHAGTQGEETFLGFNFAVHSLLMLGLAWLIPWFVLKQTQPSYAKTAHSGIKKGLRAGQVQMQDLFQQTWQNLETEKDNHLMSLKHIQDNYTQELNQSVQTLTEYMS